MQGGCGDIHLILKFSPTPAYAFGTKNGGIALRPALHSLGQQFVQTSVAQGLVVKPPNMGQARRRCARVRQGVVERHKSLDKKSAQGAKLQKLSPTRTRPRINRVGFKAMGSSNFYSTVTDFAKLRGLSTSVPRAHAVW
jgi:hypothetical protein